MTLSISSSVITSILTLERPSTVRIRLVDPLRMKTTGNTIFASSAIGGAMRLANASGAVMAIRFGTSSPTTIERYVVAAITTPNAIKPACFSSAGKVCTIHGATSSASAVAPYAPAMIPISVMPTCTVERKAEGSSCSFRATLAPRSPLSARICRRFRREETIASSESANTPLRAISARSMTRSMAGGLSHDFAACPSAPGPSIATPRRRR